MPSVAAVAGSSFAWAALATGVLVGIGVLVPRGAERQLLLQRIRFALGVDVGVRDGEALGDVEAVRVLVRRFRFGRGGQRRGATPAQQGTTTVVVLNGTTTTGLASRASAALTGAGWQVASTGDAGTTGSTSTIVYYQQASQAAVAQGIAKQLGVTAVQQSAAFPNADVSVVLGADYTG